MKPPSSNSNAVYLAGPTAVGKSEAALCLAERLGGEIISVDSMQVYGGLDIGTAKPSLEELRRIPHHLIDIASLAERFDAAQFVERAQQAETEIRSRGRRPIYCGGTGLYFKALLEGVGSAPPADETLRQELEAQPLADLLQELQQKDPVAHDLIDRNNPRRVVRALEVIRLTGRPFSEQRSSWNRSDRMDPLPTFFVMNRSPEDLKERIHRRVDWMFERGLVNETRQLLENGLAQNRTALQAIGYRQVVEHLRGERSLEESVNLVKSRTWQFARHQLTWFRHQLPARWIEVKKDEKPSVISDSLLRSIQ